MFSFICQLRIALLLTTGAHGLANTAALLASRTHSDALNDGSNIHLKGSLNHFIVVPEHKLLFCYVEKVGCTSFNNVFRFLRARYDKSQAEGVVWLRNTIEEHGISKTKLKSILKDSSWHKAVFYREPMERFISAYRSKCEGADWRYGRAHCTKMFGNESVPFEDAVNWIRDFDENHKGDDDAELELDEHFRLQTDFCGGLTNTLQYYDTVEELERETAHAKVTKMLKAVGVDAQSIPHFNELFPPASDDSWEEHRHNTNSGDHLNTYLPKEKPERALALMRHYKRDYDVFGIKPPDWAP